MPNEHFTDLPTVSNANLSDIICAVQGYISPSSLGNSVQENLQQILNLFKTNLTGLGSISFNPTTNGIIGTTNSDNASSGIVGEYISANLPSGSAITLTNSTNTNIISISVTPGDWDIFGNVFFSSTSTSNPAYIAWTSQFSNTGLDASNYTRFSYFGSTLNCNAGLICPYLRINASTTINVYLECFVSASDGSTTACGSIFARRVR